MEKEKQEEKRSIKNCSKCFYLETYKIKYKDDFRSHISAFLPI